MNKNIITINVPCEVTYKFDKNKFAEYMCIRSNLQKGTEEYISMYDVNYNYPNEHGFTDEEIQYMLDSKILVKVSINEKIDANHFDEYLYDCDE